MDKMKRFLGFITLGAYKPKTRPKVREQTADILKLDIDCCEEVFDYLWLQDVVSVGKTCKRLQQAAGYYFQQNYSNSVDIYCDFLGIHTFYCIYKKYMILNLAHFAAFIEKIQITDYGLNDFLNAQSKFHRLKHMELRDFDFTKFDDGPGITNKIWNKLEVLRFIRCKFSNDFRKTIELCVKLRHLEILWCNGEWNWLHRKHPTLEYLKIGEGSIEDIVIFLELNPNIRQFATSAEFLWENRDKMMATNIKLDILTVKQDRGKLTIYPNNDRLCDLLNKLHGRHFFKKLYWKKLMINQEEINQLATVNGLYKLHVWCRVELPFTFEALINLEEICVHEKVIFANGEQMANCLINLKRIYLMCYSSIDRIMPFIRRSAKMQTIKIDLRSGDSNEETEAINLLALNGERRELPGAHKVTMYVPEENYLATKWTYGETDFEFIRLKRSVLCESTRLI